jgi:hypothetical protein
MTDQDKRPFMDEMRRLGIAFGTAIDDAILAVYWDGLRDLALETLRQAFRDCIEQLKFLPRVADVRDAEMGVRAQREQARLDRLIAAAPPPPPRAITEDQWQERWAALKGIMARVPMKPHGGLEGDRCQCADHQRQRREANRGGV